MSQVAYRSTNIASFLTRGKLKTRRKYHVFPQEATDPCNRVGDLHGATAAAEKDVRCDLRFERLPTRFALVLSRLDTFDFCFRALAATAVRTYRVSSKPSVVALVAVVD